jgi:hypothetical protein
MLNYESLGGVNFKKGCYPGQEVVARSQFRGTLKRRAYLVHAEQALSVGQEVFSAEDLEQATGTVVQAAAAVQGGWDAIVSMQIASHPRRSVCPCGAGRRPERRCGQGHCAAGPAPALRAAGGYLNVSGPALPARPPLHFGA